MLLELVYKVIYVNLLPLFVHTPLCTWKSLFEIGTHQYKPVCGISTYIWFVSVSKFCYM